MEIVLVQVVKVGLVDRLELVRQGVEQLISAQEQYQVLLSESNEDSLLRKLKETPIDVLIVDVTIPVTEGLQLVEDVKELYPSIKIIIVSAFESIFIFERVRTLKLDGYIPKRETASSLLSAIEAVLIGKKIYVCQLDDHDELKCQFENYQTLSDREKEVFLNLAKGKPIKKIALDFEISNKTVHSHKANIFDKLGIHDDFSTTRIALKLGLIDAVDL